MLNNGDKVKSNLRGFYFGISGKIIKLAPMQDGKYKRYIIELENGKNITLSENLIIKIDTDTPGTETMHQDKNEDKKPCTWQRFLL